jgi:hypothetical protein
MISFTSVLTEQNLVREKRIFPQRMSATGCPSRCKLVHELRSTDVGGRIGGYPAVLRKLDEMLTFFLQKQTKPESRQKTTALT